MGTKILWTGLALLIAVPELFSIEGLIKAGAIIFLIGLFLLWLDK